MAIPDLKVHRGPAKGPLTSLDLMTGSFAFKTLLDDNHKELFMHSRRESERVLVPHTIPLHTGTIELAPLLPHLRQFRGVGLPAEYGGIEEVQGIVGSVILHQNLAYGSASAAAFYDGNGLFSTPIQLAGSKAQREFYLPQLAKGRIVGCYGLTDTNSGSDVANMASLSFSRQGGTTTINGTKAFITNAPIADYAVIFAREKGTKGHKGISAFIVPKTQEGVNGFTAEKPLDKLGWRGSLTSGISLSDVEVPELDLIGEFGQGFPIAATTLAYGRLKIAAEALGLMERAFDETVKFVSNRGGVGGPLHQQPVVQYQVARMAQLIQASRDTIYTTAFLAQQFDEDGMLISFAGGAARAKSLAAQSLMEIAPLAVQLHGGSGFTFEYPVAVIASDAHLYMTGEGANNVLMISDGANILRNPEGSPKQ